MIWYGHVWPRFVFHLGMPTMPMVLSSSYLFGLYLDCCCSLLLWCWFEGVVKLNTGSIHHLWWNVYLWKFPLSFSKTLQTTPFIIWTKFPWKFGIRGDPPRHRPKDPFVVLGAMEEAWRSCRERSWQRFHGVSQIWGCPNPPSYGYLMIFCDSGGNCHEPLDFGVVY